MSSDSKDTGEKQWPPEVRLARIDYAPLGGLVTFISEDPPGEFDDEAIYVGLHTIRERLLSDEAIEVLAWEIEEHAATYVPRDAAREHLIAVLERAFPAEEEQDRGEG